MDHRLRPVIFPGVKTSMKDVTVSVVRVWNERKGARRRAQGMGVSVSVVRVCRGAINRAHEGRES